MRRVNGKPPTSAGGEWELSPSGPKIKCLARAVVWGTHLDPEPKNLVVSGLNVRVDFGGGPKRGRVVCDAIAPLKEPKKLGWLLLEQALVPLLQRCLKIQGIAMAFHLSSPGVDLVCP